MENGRGKANFKFQPHHLPAVTMVLSYVFKMGMIIKSAFPGCWQGDMATQAEDRFNKSKYLILFRSVLAYIRD